MKKVTIKVIIMTLATMATLHSSGAMAGSAEDAAARQQLLNLSNEKRPQTVEIANASQVSKTQQEFVEFFRDFVWPKMQELKALSQHYGAIQVAFDRALFRDDAEKKAWMDELVKTETAINKISNGDEWKKMIETWSEMSIGLEGRLAEFARNSWKDIEVGAFDQAMMPRLERLSVLSTEIGDLANSVPSAEKRPEAEAKIGEAAAEFHAGKISFEEATKRIEAAELVGDIAFGKELSEKAGAQLNESAIIRTELAKSKGFKSWAEFTVAKSARFYGGSIKTVEGQIQFMRDILRLTQPAFEHFLGERAKEISGADAGAWRTSQIDNLVGLPADSLVRDHFPREAGESRWREAMLAGGFQVGKLDHIVLDSLPRPGKMGHGGYMYPVASHAPKKLTIDAKTLEIETGPDTPENFYDAAIYIVQNLRSDGTEGHETAFHEGGHALHGLAEVNPLDDGSAYGYVEVHSMTMEYFGTDLDYLARAAKTRDGKAIPKEVMEQFVRNTSINKLLLLRTLASRALFELRLWSEEYAPGSNYIETSKRLWAETMREGVAYKAAPTATYDWSYYSFVRPHFRSAWVQYSGYVFASAGSGLTAQALLERFEKETGRRSLDRQPTLAEKLYPYYRDGYRLPFPESVEQFTGHKFSLEEFANGAAKEAAAYKGVPCAGKLVP